MERQIVFHRIAVVFGEDDEALGSSSMVQVSPSFSWV
jgi:hypothetical protein